MWRVLLWGRFLWLMARLDLLLIPSHPDHVGGLVAFVLVLSAGPLTVFFRKLRAAKRRGTFEYGALGCAVGRQFERKWLARPGGVDESALDAPDFSATTDLYQVVANVYDMDALPFGLKSLSEPVVVTLLPFVPVTLMAVPLDVVLEGIAKLLL